VVKATIHICLCFISESKTHFRETFVSCYYSNIAAQNSPVETAFTAASSYSVNILKVRFVKLVVFLLQQFFQPGIVNIRANNGDPAVNDEHILGICRQVLEEVSNSLSCLIIAE